MKKHGVVMTCIVGVCSLNSTEGIYNHVSKKFIEIRKRAPLNLKKTLINGVFNISFSKIAPESQILIPTLLQLAQL